MTTDFERDAPLPTGYVTVTMPQDDVEDVIDILTRELAGHHNRTESYLVGDAVLYTGDGTEPNIGLAVESANNAKRIRRLRAHFHRAMSDRKDA